MIYVDRGQFAEPEIFKTNKVETIRKKIQLFYKSNPEILEQKPVSAIPELKEVQHNIYKDNEVKNALSELFHGKCAYCESRIYQVSSGDISEFRPKNGVVEKGKYNHLYYGWLSFEWQNLYLCCEGCNRAKNNLFPVDGKRAPYLSSLEQTRKLESYLLIDPCFDNPQEHISFNGPRAMALTHRGEETIKILELNRPGLVEMRSQDLAYLEKSIFRLVLRIKAFNKGIMELAEIKEEFDQILTMLKSPNTPYRGCQLAFAKNILFENKVILDFTNEHKIGWDNFFTSSQQEEKKITVKHESKYRTINKIIVKNLKGLKDFEVELNENEEKNWLMILGENATGKSTLLKLIAMNLVGKKGRKKSYSITAESLVDYGKTSGSIRLVFTGEPLYERELIFNSDGSWSGSADKPFPMEVLGYGPVRLPSNIKFSRIQKVRNLFDHFTPLINMNEWLIQCYHEDRELFSGAVRCIRSMAPLQNQKDNDFLLIPVEMHLVFQNLHRTDDEISFDSLSSGYRSIFTLVIDIFHKMGQPDSNLARGIVLLDEIDVHLHPRWKMSIVSQLKELFKHVQFITTTHDPLCLRGLNKGEIMVLERKGDGVQVQFDELPSPEGLRTDQLLTSEFFGLSSTMDKDTEQLFLEYYALLAKRKRSVDENNRVKDIKSQLKGLKYMGTGRREQLMYEVIDEYLANTQHLSVTELKEKSLKQKVFTRITEIWKNSVAGDLDD
ncbi:TIGR02646 family protein [Bacillus sp. OV166]|uniref:AAA family ATPase n=1 Tax=Bacillus sp. OV166 TaxID=1882763 RepID=UPI000A2AE75A|nr:AAA family ATPase [Bacillus sp. OV166]SMQ61005.1 TIGR02646 family protein [Bacillus sp. OV166]